VNVERDKSDHIAIHVGDKAIDLATVRSVVVIVVIVVK